MPTITVPTSSRENGSGTGLENGPPGTISAPFVVPNENVSLVIAVLAVTSAPLMVNVAD